MKNLRNKVQLIGNLGVTPQVTTLDNGNTLAKFSLATSETYTSKDGEKITDTQWHQIVAWGKTAQFAGNYLDKGSRIALEGKLTNRMYQDKDGVKRYIVEVVAHELLSLSKKEE